MLATNTNRLVFLDKLIKYAVQIALRSYRSIHFYFYIDGTVVIEVFECHTLL